MKYRATIILFVGVVLLLVAYLSSDINRARLIGGRGDKNSGSQFGVRIGQPVNEALSRLSSLNFSQIELDIGTRCLNTDLEAEGLEVVALVERNRNDAVVCVGHRDGQVKRLVWSFGGWQF